MNYTEQIYSTSGWLGSPGWQSRDRHLSRAAASGIRFRHPPEDVAFAPGTANIIRGPRQIGKSTECKFIIDASLSRGLDPSQCVYFPCDNLMRRQEIAEVTRVAIGIAQPTPDKPLTLAIF